MTSSPSGLLVVDCPVHGRQVFPPSSFTAAGLARADHEQCVARSAAAERVGLERRVARPPAKSRGAVFAAQRRADLLERAVLLRALLAGDRGAQD